MKRKKLRKYISTLIAVVLLCGLATPSALAVSTSAIPISVNTSTYIRGYCVAVHDMAKQRTYVYTNSALTNRNKNEYISAKTDEIRIIARSSKYDSVYVSYPTSKGRKKRWIPTAAVFSINSYKRMKAASSCKTYKFKSSSYSYGSISAGDIVYTYNTSGSFTRVIYPTGRTWKMAWVRTSDLNGDANGQKSMTNALYGINVSGSYITCGFDGYVNTKGRHEGIDFKCGIGKAVYALTSGEVTRITNGFTGRNGLSTIAIYNSDTNKTVVYLHTAPTGLKVGQKINKGTKIATESWRGISSKSGAHTHVEVRNGRRTAAAKSVNDNKLDNSNPTSFWEGQGYVVK